ncbi:MAG TPA: glycoside hydrolase family 19 protein [Vicinamibacterales bacterium]|nr:glycoside hydrolase family 19 protein [Vicinamibacterales bacterium]
MLTDEQLRGIMRALPAARRAAFLPFVQAAIVEFAIDLPARAAAFLAQLAHESGQLRFMEEIWGPTDAQRRYEPPGPLATTLGNTEAGDGKRFKGRGPIQITGRDNYRRYGDLLGVDLVATPTQASKPELAFRIAGLFWSRNGLNELSDEVTADAFRTITRRINGGLNGLADRERFYAVARTVLGVTAAHVMRAGTRGRTVPVAPPEATFVRGHEAIRASRRRKRARKARRTPRSPPAVAQTRARTNTPITRRRRTGR